MELKLSAELHKEAAVYQSLQTHGSEVFQLARIAQRINEQHARNLHTGVNVCSIEVDCNITPFLREELERMGYEVYSWKIQW